MTQRLQGGLILVLWLAARVARGKLATWHRNFWKCSPILLASSIADEPQLAYQVIATAS
jgi:hypothetical protein